MRDLHMKTHLSPPIFSGITNCSLMLNPHLLAARIAILQELSRLRDDPLRSTWGRWRNAIYPLIQRIHIPRRYIVGFVLSIVLLWVHISEIWTRWVPLHPESIRAVKYPSGASTVAGGGKKVFSKMVVMPRLKNESVAWFFESFEKDEHIKSTVYVVDDETAENHVSTNKGHEVMVYLTYIIENYNNLSDVNIFMHSQKITWHNNVILNDDSTQLISRISGERVQREGYMNLRCHWHPGCPDWMHPRNKKYDKWKPEELKLAQAWRELFPFDRVPKVLGQPCCGQFALSAERIRSLPLNRYVDWRSWLLQTDLPDNISGRVWEYFWQFVFTGKNVHCPVEHICYCDGYSVCFGGKKEFDEYMDKNGEKDRIQKDLDKWKKEYGNLTEQIKAAEIDKDRKKLMAEIGTDLELEGKVNKLKAWLEKRVEMAKERGDDPKLKAAEIGLG